jgi:hypothetical protein
MTSEPTLDLQRLHWLYASSAVAKLALDGFASRNNKSAETTVEGLSAVLYKSNSSFRRQDVVEFFKELQQTNSGEFVIGRRGKPSRFVWWLSLVDVGLAAQGRKSVDQIADPEEIVSIEESDDEVTFTHAFQLRRNQRVEFRLPTDLTPVEAGRLADFLKTLPLEAP